LSASLGLSRTPVREALFRLMGEGVIESGDIGGCRLLRLDAGRLAELYIWAQGVMLSVLGILSQDELIATLRLQEQRHRTGTPLLLGPHIFQALADATGSREFSRQVENINDRLILARLGEAAVLPERPSEALRFLQTSGKNIKNGIRQKIIAYYRVRYERSGLISERIEIR
jgi:DNA-binding GntR family transcriptional regulator